MNGVSGAYPLRRATNAIQILLFVACAVASVSALLFILGYTAVKGAAYVDPEFFVHVPRPLGESGGGAANALIGTAIMVGLASAMGIPAGLAAGVLLSEYAGPRLGTLVRFVADVLTGVPSIVVGVFVYLVLVVRMGGFSALAGAVALAIIMLPIVARSSEEMLRLVPNGQREAALALGLSRWRSILSVVIPAAMRGLMTGALLAVARAAGETAPLLFTSLGNQYLSTDLTGEMDALPLRIYRYAIGPYTEWHQQAWAAALVLVLLVLGVSGIARLIISRQGGRA